MELPALLMICGVGVAGAAALLLLMSLFSTSGTSYEEAIAQQRKATTELLALAENKNKPKKNNKKANKKLAKKERNKEVTLTTGSEHESEAPVESGMEDDNVPQKPHVEFCPPIVVDVPRDSLPNVKIRKRLRDLKVKPILINKDDPSCISDPSTPPSPTGSNVSNHFEEIHPKDDFELLQSSLAIEKTPEKKEEIVEKKDVKGTKQLKSGKSHIKQQQKVEVQPVEVAKEEVVYEQQNSGDTPKEQRKAKKLDKKAAIEDPVENPKEVTPPLQLSQTSEVATEKTIKQKVAGGTAPSSSNPSPSSSGKTKKKKQEANVLTLMAGDSGGVNVGELVRVVRDAVLSRTEIQILTDALLNKHHDPLPEHSEWTEGPNDPMQKLKKQLADKEKALADEIEASQALHAKLKELRTNLNAEKSRATAAVRSSEAAAANLQSVTHALQERIQRLVDENQALAQDKLVLQAKLSAESEAQAQRVQMEVHIQRLTESETALISQLQALQAETNACSVECAQARCEAHAARETAVIAQQHAVELSQQLQDANHAYGELEQRVTTILHNEQLAIQEMQRSQQRIAELENELQNASAGAIAAEETLEKLKEGGEREKEQLISELSVLKEQLALREAEVGELKQMSAITAHNGITAANEQLKAAELAKVEAVMESLRSDLLVEQGCVREQREQIVRLQEQVARYQDKNNEAISKAQETYFQETANVLRSVCPSAAPSSATGREWLQAFAENLKNELQKKTTSNVSTITSPQDTSRLQDLVVQNEQLQSLVDKYKFIIDDTEGVLSRLQHNVTTEEQKWSQQLAEKQRELDDLRQRTITQMQSKIDRLEAELQHSKSGSHNHSFAESERLAEERLMGDLSDKHKLDVSNGPLQVPLQDK